jgi:superfamily II DNA or RNA helicase
MNYREVLQEQVERYTRVIPWTDFALEEHQEEAMLWVWNALDENRDYCSIVHSCGSWKTIVEWAITKASEDAKAILNIDAPNIILSTERALLYSIQEQLEELWIDLWVWWAWSKVLDRWTLLCSIQSLQRCSDINRLIPTNRVPLVLWDEADKYLTDKRSSIIRNFSQAVRIWLTATESWPDGRNISDLFWGKVHHIPLRNGISRWINTPPIFYLYESKIDTESISISRWDYERKSLKRALKEAEIEKSVTEIYFHLVPKDKRKEFPTLVYVASVDLVHETKKNFEEIFAWEDVNISAWTWKTVSNTQMQDDISDFKNWKIDVLVLCEMWGRWIDLPNARVLIDGYPTLSENKLEQRHGRVTRKIRIWNFHKPFSIIAQIIPSHNMYRPAILPDIICPEELVDLENGQLLNVSKDWRILSWLEWASVQEEVIALRNKITAQQPACNIRLVWRINTLEEVQRYHNLPQVNSEWFVVIDEVRYTSIEKWAQIFSLKNATVAKSLIDADYIEGLINWRKCKLYRESIVRKSCDIDTIKSLPHTNDDREIIIEWVIYKTVEDLSFIANLHADSIRALLKKKWIVWIDGRLSDTGNIVRFYTQEQIRNACSEHIVEYQADINWIIMQGDDLYGTISGYYKKKLLISWKAITKRVQDSQIVWIKWKLKNGHVSTFYKEGDIRDICADLLDGSLPNCDEHGFFELEWVKYWVLTAWERVWKASESFLYRKVKNINSTKGKDKKGSICSFYSEAQIDSVL